MELILEDINFMWKKEEINKVKDMWNGGESLKDITEAVNREGDEVFLLLLHLARQRKIKIRKGFIWGK
ncbi:hypothetical protein [Clostridium cavendishii]|uniref:hypothetical protein n=1 Tax=Clostridium cavendishii TaxID=349931 RepID=UPI000932DFA8|nr:hypothetical protein [Clostridium cavendishii]